MKKYFYALIVLVFAVALFFLLKPKPIPVEVAIVKQGVFEETLAVDGIIRSRNKKTVYALASGNLVGYTARVGDVVKKNQILTKLLWGWDVMVKSPIDGVITKIYRDSRGPIQRGEPIFEVANMSELEVVSDVLTPDALGLSVGGEVKILNWGGEEELSARILRISKAAKVKISALGVEEERTEVIVVLEKSPNALIEKLGDNYHVDVIFVISKTPKALSIPIGALIKVNDTWAVYLVQNGKSVLKEIQITKRNEREALVSSGLNEGETIILYPGDEIHPGSLVETLSKSD